MSLEEKPVKEYTLTDPKVKIQKVDGEYIGNEKDKKNTELLPEVRNLYMLGACIREKDVPVDIQKKVKALRNFHSCNVKKCQIEGNHMHVERSPFFETAQYFIAAVEECDLLHRRLLMHIKPANYNG